MHRFIGLSLLNLNRFNLALIPVFRSPCAEVPGVDMLVERGGEGPVGDDIDQTSP